MRKLSLIVGLFFAYPCFAQDVDKLIRQSDVERIISTLAADDMQGRATFRPGIEKAAKFIESEYKQIGLKPLPGDDGFRQNFNMTRMTPVKTLVEINGKLVGADSVCAKVHLASIEWSNDKNVAVTSIASGKNFIAEYRSMVRSNKKMLVFVDPEFTALFNKLRDVNLKGSIVTKSSDTSAVILFWAIITT